MVLQNEQWESLAARAYALTQQRKDLEKQEKEAYDLLKQLSGDMDSYYGAWEYTCTMRKGTVDYMAIPQLKGVDLDTYRKDSVPVWSLKPYVDWRKQSLWTDSLTEYIAKCSEGEREFLIKAIDASNFKHDTYLVRKFIDDQLETYNLLKFKGRIK